MLNIEFARGDSYQRGFILKRNSQTVTETFDDVYFTVKRRYTDRNFVFQKRMSTGGIVDNGEGHYTLFIEPYDTNGLPFGEYDIDIEVEKGEYKRTFYGKMLLNPEVTHAMNEG